MEVAKFKTDEGKERYYLADSDGVPIESVLKFIKFKDNTNYSRNTLRMYCQHLKLCFEYLEQREINFQDVTIDDLALFVNLLQNPCESLSSSFIWNESCETMADLYNFNIYLNIEDESSFINLRERKNSNRYSFK